MDNLTESFSEIKEIHKSVQRTILTAIDLKTEEPVIIKLTTQASDTFENEIKIYTHLQNETKGKPSPKLLWTEEFKDGTKAFALEALGPNLEQLFETMNRRMSLRTLLTLGNQMIKCIEKLHKRGVLHCDLRPENFVLDPDKNSKRLYLIGFSKAEFIGEYLAPDMSKRICRRASFLSLSSQMGFRYGYRDDLESIGLILVYFHEGQLPWQGILVEDDETRFDLIANVKSKIKLEKLCENLPEHFERFFNLCWKLKADEVPNYKEFRKVFRQLFVLNKFKKDVMFDTVKSTFSECQNNGKPVEMINDEKEIKIKEEKNEEETFEHFEKSISDLQRSKGHILAKAILDSSDDNFEYLSEKNT